MLALEESPLFVPKTFDASKIPTSTRRAVVCAAKGPRPRYPQVWKTKRRIGAISKAAKLVKNVKELSNVKEEVHGVCCLGIRVPLDYSKECPKDS